MLTFDDGPSIRRHFNPSRSILKQLANNDVQNGIKAIFFVQTRNGNGGGSVEGKAIIREISAAGHVVGVHSVDPRGHVSHLNLTIEELNQSLANGKQDIEQLTGITPLFIRPPFLAYTAQIQVAYAAQGMGMLLTDISANDGVISP